VCHPPGREDSQNKPYPKAGFNNCGQPRHRIEPLPLVTAAGRLSKTTMAGGS